MSVDQARTARSAMWSLLENAGLSLISMGTLVIFTRLLSAAEFGLFAVVLALTELLQVLVTMLFHDALVQREHVSELHFDTAFTVGMALSVLLSLGCCAISPWFAVAVHEPRAAAVLCAASLCFPASAASATIVARQRRELSFQPLALRSLLGRFIGAFAGVGLILAGAGVWGLLAQQVLIQAMGSLILWKTCERRPRLRFGRVELRELLGFGAYAMGSLWVVFGVKRVFAVVSGIFLGIETAGYLNLSFRAVDVFWSIASTAATQVALPTLASLQSDLPRLKRAVEVATSFVCVILYSCFVGLGLVAPEVVRLMFGEKWLPAAPFVSVLSALVLIQAPRVLVAPLLTALGRPRDLLFSKTCEMLFVALALVVTRVPTLGWAIGIWVTRELVALPITLELLRRRAGLNAVAQLRGALVPLLAALTMAGVASLVRWVLPPTLSLVPRLVLLVASGALTFCLVCAALDRELVKKLLKFAHSAVARRKAAVPAPALALGRAP